MKKIFITILMVLAVVVTAMAKVNYSRQLEEKAYLGDDQAMFELSVCYRNGYGVSVNPDKANYWLERAAEEGNPKASTQLEMLGNKTALSDTKRRQLAAEEKSERERLEAKNQHIDYSKYNDALVKKAQSGDAKAQNSLGWCYQYGIGVTKNYNEAVKWYRKSAEQGYANGQTNLGYCYQHGYSVTQDYSKAVQWFRKAAEQGEAFGQNQLGACYYYGYGVTKDYNEAVKWFRKAAEQGNFYGQYDLGLFYENGYGVTKDINKAVEWYRKAARQGYEEAQKALKRLGYSW